MKKYIITAASLSLVAILSGCAGSSNSATPSTATKTNSNQKNDIMSLDVTKVCDASKVGVKSALAMAKKYNPIAVKKGLEFKRLGMKNSQYIKAIDGALKTGAKEITLLNKKGKPTKKKMNLVDASTRSCKFAIRALQQNVEAQTDYHYAVPGDKFTY